MFKHKQCPAHTFINMYHYTYSLFYSTHGFALHNSQDVRSFNVIYFAIVRDRQLVDRAAAPPLLIPAPSVALLNLMHPIRVYTRSWTPSPQRYTLHIGAASPLPASDSFHIHPH